MSYQNINLAINIIKKICKEIYSFINYTGSYLIVSQYEGMRNEDTYDESMFS